MLQLLFLVQSELFSEVCAEMGEHISTEVCERWELGVAATAGILGGEGGGGRAGHMFRYEEILNSMGKKGM
jgi:hypothetical protein